MILFINPYWSSISQILLQTSLLRDRQVFYINAWIFIKTHPEVIAGS